MVHGEVFMDVKLLHRQGASIREIARRTGLSRVTVRRILAQPAPRPYGPREPRPSKLAPFVATMERMLGERPRVMASVIYEHIAAEGYDGHYEGVKRWVRARRSEIVARRQACVRFETGPGVEAQFDWKGPARGLIASDPELAVHFFRFQLAWSRRYWTLVVTSLQLPAVLACLRWAFEQAGGVPQRLVLDNPKTAVLRPRPHLVLHPHFADFCAHYDVEAAPALVYTPERKGKIERSFGDIGREGILERRFDDLSHLQRAIDACDEKHAQRVHGTTGARPQDRFESEAAHLKPLPAVAFDPRVPQIRRVLRTCCVSFEGAHYSVPYHFVGKKVVVKADPLASGVEIFAGHELIARHERVPKGREAMLEEHLEALRRPRFDRLRERVQPPKHAPRAVPRSVVPWPAVLEAATRPIEDYAAAIGATP